MDLVPPAPAQTAPQPQPVSPLPKPPTKIWVLIMGGILLLGVGIVGGVFLGKQLYSTSTSQPTPSPIVEAAPTPDPTADWREVKANSIYFKVPKNFRYIKCSTENTISLDPGFSKDIEENCSLKNKGVLIIKQVNGPFPESLLEASEPNRNTSPFSMVSESKEITIDGHPAQRAIEERFRGTDNGKYLTASVFRSEKLEYLILVSFSDISQGELFDQILSTFRFVGQ